MKGKALNSLAGRSGQRVWVAFEPGSAVCCGYEDGPSTEIDDLAQHYPSGCYRVDGSDLVYEDDASIRVFQFNSLIHGIYEWIETAE